MKTIILFFVSILAKLHILTPMTSQGGYQDFYTQGFLNKMGELTILPIDNTK